jgi:glycosyltransferase 2 family protein
MFGLGRVKERYDGGLSALSSTQAPSDRFRNVRNWTLIIVTNLVSFVCMYFVLSGAHINLIWGEVRHMAWHWVMLAVIADVFVYTLQSWRWLLVLKPVETISLWTSIRAIYVGLFANEVLPLRTGELIRCFLVSRWSSIPLSVSFASALIERIFDGIWLMGCFFITLQLADLPHRLEQAGYILGILIAIAAVILAIGMYARRQALDLFFGFSFPKWFTTLVEDLHLIGHSRYLYFAFLASGAFMLAQIIPIYAVIEAYGLDLDSTLIASFTMMVLLRLSSAVPQAPGNLGLFQGVAFRTLIVFGVYGAVAKRFSLILWAVVTIPLIVAGFLVLSLSGASIAHLHREATSAAQASRSES